MRVSTRIAFALCMACLPSTFHDARAEGTTSVKAGRIYVATIYRVEQPVRADGAIIAVDPATADWQLVTNKDARAGSGGDAVRLSPDRRTLVFARHRDGIWKCESDGQFPTKIFDLGGGPTGGIPRPIWSPDGKHLVVAKGEYIKKDTGNVWQSETWQIDADGRNPVKLAIPDTDNVDDWSPDGQWFVTSTTRKSDAGQLYLIKTDGTQQRRLTEGGGGNSEARFSPDGKKIVYLRRTRAEGTSIWTVGADGANATKIVTEADLSVPAGAFWAPDGKQIAVVVFDWQVNENGQKTYPSLGMGKFRIEVMDSDGTNRRPIPLKGETLPFISSMGDWR